jgi:predicted RNA-binding protein associated with RNAse of E/G family
LAPTRITEIKTTLSGECKRFDCELLTLNPGEAVVIYRMPRDVVLEDLLLPRGGLSLGYFWEERAYNAYHWVDDNRQTLALYFNICDNTCISPTQIAWRDLTVDILITPDLRCRVLDEDELPDDIDSELLSRINATRDSLCADASRLLSEFETRSRALLAEG